MKTFKEHIVENSFDEIPMYTILNFLDRWKEKGKLNQSRYNQLKQTFKARDVSSMELDEIKQRMSHKLKTPEDTNSFMQGLKAYHRKNK